MHSALVTPPPRRRHVRLRAGAHTSTLPSISNAEICTSPLFLTIVAPYRVGGTLVNKDRYTQSSLTCTHIYQCFKFVRTEILRLTPRVYLIDLHESRFTQFVYLIIISRIHFIAPLSNDSLFLIEYCNRLFSLGGFMALFYSRDCGTCESSP